MMWVIKFILSRWCFNWQRQLLRVRFLSVAAGMEKPRDGLMSKICKQNALLCLTCSLGMPSCDINRKQNRVCCFQTVNLSFLSRNSATFASKVTEFLVVNQWVFEGGTLSIYKTAVIISCFVLIFQCLSVTFARKGNLLRIARLVGLFEFRITKDLLFLFLSS